MAGAARPFEVLPSDYRGHYPHMAIRDVEVWTAFLQAHSGEYQGFAYDVAVGGVALEAPGMPPAQVQGWRENTALRIDAVGYREREVVVIEVKPGAYVNAVGAVVCYAATAIREEVFELPVRMAIVCAYMQIDVRACCAELGIEVWTVAL
jgi:hypothetical protein